MLKSPRFAVGILILYVIVIDNYFRFSRPYILIFPVIGRYRRYRSRVDSRLRACCNQILQICRRSFDPISRSSRDENISGFVSRIRTITGIDRSIRRPCRDQLLSAQRD